ncbi:hypothetical protein [Streptomyces sp. NPDC017868]|uniref:hypothetical protein n=1 Tax=Streptomyces sp. NPDC017868 TaxID=3365014 RepID=UPI0037BB937B
MRLAGALVGALALAALPSTALADIGDPIDTPTPPKGCNSYTGYNADDDYSAKLEICFTTKRQYSADLGAEIDAPAVSVTATCWHKTMLLWSEAGHCDWTGDLAMTKDGLRAWKEHWGMKTEATHQGARTQSDHYRCRGNGTYTLTLDNITMEVSNNGVTNDYHKVPMKSVSVTGKGC